MLVLLSGPSGSGKNTVIEALRERIPKLQYFRSATTRPPRGAEENYIFLTPEMFAQKQNAGDFFETEEVHGYWYGTLRSELEKLCRDRSGVYVKDIDVRGQATLLARLRGQVDILSIFLDAPDTVLSARLASRGECADRIAVRLSRAALERAQRYAFDLVIENDNLEETISQIERAIVMRMQALHK